MDEEKKERTPKPLGMKLSDLTEGVLDDVLKIYDEVVGGNGVRYSHRGAGGDIGYAKKALTSIGMVEWRYGSRLSSNSKLYIRTDEHLPDGDSVVKFSFYPNLDEREYKRVGKEADELRVKFKESVEDYLTRKNLAVEAAY